MQVTHVAQKEPNQNISPKKTYGEQEAHEKILNIINN